MDDINSDLSDFEFIEQDGRLETQTPGAHSAHSEPSDLRRLDGPTALKAMKKVKRVRRMGITMRSSPRSSIAKLEADDDEDGRR